MKKTILLGAAAMMLVATSCSNDETVEMPKSDAIGFKTMVDMVQGRAAGSANTGFTAFEVWGYKGNDLVFDAQKVTGTVGGDWNYNPLKYWVAASNYSFTAVGSNLELSSAEYTATKPTAWNQNGFGYFTFSNESAKGNEDVVYAFNSRETAATLDDKSTAIVGFDFQHSLARVKFTFNNGFSSAYEMEVSGLTINNAISSGRFTLPEATWAKKGDATFALPYESSKAVNVNTPAVCDYQYIIPIPQEQMLEVSFTVTITDTATGDQHVFNIKNKQLALPASGNNAANVYLSNHSYNFTATLDPDNVDPDNTLKPIEFEANVGGWTEPVVEGTVTVE